MEQIKDVIKFLETLQEDDKISLEELSHNRGALKSAWHLINQMPDCDDCDREIEYEPTVNEGWD